MFCKHKWEILSETTTESKLELTVKTFHSAGYQPNSLPHQVMDADRKLIQLVTCGNCGKLKRFVSNI